MLMAASGEIKIVNRLKEREHFSEKSFIHWLLDVPNIVTDMLPVRGTDERGGDVRVRASILDRELDDIDAFCRAKLDGFAATFDDRLACGVPVGNSACRKQAHAGGRGIDDTDTFFGEVWN